MTGIRERLQNNWSLDKLHLWGNAFGHVRLYADGLIAICVITHADLEENHCSKEDLEGLVEWLRKIRGVKVGCLIKEEERKKCKFSLRSYGETDVRAMAEVFGGGGHLNAAGGTIFASPAEALDKLVGTMTDALQGWRRRLKGLLQLWSI